MNGIAHPCWYCFGPTYARDGIHPECKRRYRAGIRRARTRQRRMRRERAAEAAQEAQT